MTDKDADIYLRTCALAWWAQTGTAITRFEEHFEVGMLLLGRKHERMQGDMGDDN